MSNSLCCTVLLILCYFSLLVLLLEVVPTRRSERGTITPESFTSGRTIIYSISLFRENNNVVVFPIPFHIFMPLANLWLIRLRGQFSILRTRSCPDLYPLIRPPKRPLALGRGRILIPGFVRSPPTLAVQDVAHSLPRGGVGSHSLRLRPEGISHTSLVHQRVPILMTYLNEQQKPSWRAYPYLGQQSAGVPYGNRSAQSMSKPH